MKYISYLLIFFLSIAVKLVAQDRSHTKYGVVDRRDLEMKYYEKDSSAEAVVLYDYADEYFVWNTFEKTYFFNATHHIRIKIFKKSGLDHANRTIQYINGTFLNSEQITNIKGCTYNLVDGKTVTTKLEKESIFDEQIYENDYQKKIKMPDVKEGSIFELEYTRETPFWVRNKPYTWAFQEDIPNEWSEINLTIPDFLHYKIIMGGYFPLFINKKEGATVNFTHGYSAGTKYIFAAKDLPAFHNESYITTKSDYISKVVFELSGYQFPGEISKNFTESWADMNNTLLMSVHFGERLKESAGLRDIVKSIEPITDSMEKINAAFKYVSKNIKYDNSAHTVYVFQDLKRTMEDKKGSAAEINLIMVNLLRQLGFDANPVILSTRNNGKIKEDFPMLSDFNYVIAEVKIGGKELLMDATEPYSYPGLLPERCLNGNGRLIKKNDTRFVSLAPAEKFSKFEYVTAEVDAVVGEIKGMYSITSSGYRALEKRIYFNSIDEKTLREKLNEDRPDWHKDSIKIEEKNNPLVPLKVSYGFSFDNSNLTKSIIYLNPMITGKITDNLFKAPERIYPVDFTYPLEEIFMASIKLPAGYTVDEIPKSEMITLPDGAGRFMYAMDVTDNTVRVSSKLSIYKTNFTPAEYHYLTEFYNKIIQKHSEVIVLKKNK